MVLTQAVTFLRSIKEVVGVLVCSPTTHDSPNKALTSLQLPQPPPPLKLINTQAVTFLRRIKEVVEDPRRLLLDV